MNRRHASLALTISDALRGLGFDEKLSKPLEAPPGQEARSMQVGVFERSDGDALTLLRLVVTCGPLDARELRIRPVTIASTFWALIGFTRTVATNDRELDRRALVETREDVATRAALTAGLAAVARELFELDASATLRVAARRLVLDIEAREGVLERAVELAARAVRALDAARIRPREKEAPVRCGFCHAELSTVDEKVVRCDRCAAPVHASCWEDHEGCPVLGCAGAAR